MWRIADSNLPFPFGTLHRPLYVTLKMLLLVYGGITQTLLLPYHSLSTTIDWSVNIFLQHSEPADNNKLAVGWGNAPHTLSSAIGFQDRSEPCPVNLPLSINITEGDEKVKKKLAGLEGFEPPLKAPKASVLPLHQRPRMAVLGLAKRRTKPS